MPVRPLGRPARHLGVVASTMTEAADWAASGAPHGALVTATHQAAGRGRHGRTWEAAPGQSLLLSLVLSPVLPPDRLGLVPLAAGLAVTEAVASFGVAASVKWPNDVRVGGRKLAGVLAETTWTGPEATVVLGVGLNVEQEGFPEALAETATSLRIVTGRPVDRLAPLDAVLTRLAHRLGDAETDPDRLLGAVETRLEGLGEPATLSYPGLSRPDVSGRVLGLAPDGALRLDTEAGEVAAYAGEVTLARAPS